MPLLSGILLHPLAPTGWNTTNGNLNNCYKFSFSTPSRDDNALEYIKFHPWIKRRQNITVSRFINVQRSDFGGLGLACWPLVPTFAGSNPAEAVEKILITPSFGGEVKPSVPCRRFTACKRSLNATCKSGISSKIYRPFLAHIVPPLATRILGDD